MIKYFYLEESQYYPKHYVIKLQHDKLPVQGLTNGSFNVLPARLLSISYANYLRLCRDEFGAEIIGKNTLYPVAYFTKNQLVDELIRLLNKRVESCIYDREHPYDFIRDGDKLIKVGWNNVSNK